MSTAKLDFIREYEVKIQKEWEDKKSFEIDSLVEDDPEHPKYLATFPYPYMNGRLHIGHVFTVSKAEFMCQYQRLKGKRVLFPFAFHCTGMPIKVCADKLKKEIEEFGCPPVFPVETEEDIQKAKEEKQKQQQNQPTQLADQKQYKAKKTKAVSKQGAGARQWNIMKSLDIPDEEIPKFADTAYWLNYFPPHCVNDLKAFGAGIDWRRSFITTDVNKYYDSFVRWQFTTLKEQGKVKFGERYSIWSTTDDQQCADHERSQGEGVLPQNYTLIKLQVQEPIPEVLKPIHAQGKKIYLVPGTLRPETMYGQTNCWIHPEHTYGAYQMINDEVFICTERSARNMAYQKLTPEKGQYECLATFTGAQIMGAALKAPLAINKTVYVLPMMSIDENKGTGVVTSVPSDAPDDYAALVDLKNKQPMRVKFGVKDEWVMPFEVIPIIDIPGYSNQSAVKAYQDLNIKSQNDRVLLDQAKDICYLKGFNDGVLIVGPYAGKKVSEVKKQIKEELIQSGQAVEYSEPASKVVSRSGDECVVALSKQWYINYGEGDQDWKEKVLQNLAGIETFIPETKKKFEYAIGWLNQWACSRSFGLGTKMPWAEEFLIESLSDSTIYMAFYTIANYLQSDFNGTVPGKAGIKPEEMTHQVWDYIFQDDKPYPQDCKVSKEVLDKLKREFNYWYPVDLRVSGIDLVQNHLTFFIYNHAAIFSAQKQPKGIRANGFVYLNGKKMSKSEGNFLTLYDSIKKYSADGTRVALADAGDGIEDANFVAKTAESALLKLHTQIQWIQETLETAKESLIDEVPSRLADKIFESEINRIIVKAEQAYDRTNFRDALHLVLFDLLNVRDSYKSTVEKMNKQLIMKFIEIEAILCYPITPHFSQHIYNMLGKGSILDARWPVAGPIDYDCLKKNEYIKHTVHSARNKLTLYQKSKSKEFKDTPQNNIKPKSAIINYANSFPQWQAQTLTYLHSVYDPKTNSVPKTNAQIASDLKTQYPELKSLEKHLMSFVAIVLEQIKIEGVEALQVSVSFDEKELLQENMDYITKTLELTDVFDIQEYKYSNQEQPSKPGSQPIPGKPTFTFQ
ncbi:leucyl-tRNA synthetase [Tieghemostelium lacteum]|uniref:leucine--tRNA ligase n=1 Tax=Tieghemostelium lacteum TaxID=361077 RepID=A0A151ZJN2_TIELA|nr:leucyl-tRNA synthetase [Tieghemostelium lacteum]|eukprot:KYQ94208.1 leucyl-tRNA synthetase [Tieghemostelium lacteum]